jgi:hypothetical protein
MTGSAAAASYPPLVPASRERAFFTGTALWFLAMTLVGFSPTFYFRVDPEPLAAPFIVHGVVYSCWMGLFFVQATLIANRRVEWHRALGVVGLVLLVAMVPAGIAPVLYKVSAGTKTPSEGWFNLTGLAFGWTLGFLGLAFRRRPYVHKRLLLFATLAFGVAAADRVSAWMSLDDVRLFRKALAVVPALALVGYDAATRRRLPVLALSLLGVVWLMNYFLLSDWLFDNDASARLIERAARALFP